MAKRRKKQVQRRCGRCQGCREIQAIHEKYGRGKDGRERASKVSCERQAQTAAGRTGRKARVPNLERLERALNVIRAGASKQAAYTVAGVSERSWYRYEQRGAQLLEHLSSEGADLLEEILGLVSDRMMGDTWAVWRSTWAEQLSWTFAQQTVISENPELVATYLVELREAAESIELPDPAEADLYVQFVCAIRRARAELEVDCFATMQHAVSVRKNWVAAATVLDRSYGWSSRKSKDSNDPQAPSQVASGRDTDDGRRRVHEVLWSKEASEALSEQLRKARPALTEQSAVASASGDGGNGR